MRANYFKSIFDIDYSLYPKVKVLLFDIDNTLVHPFVRHPSDEVKEYINNLKEKGYEIFLYSNNIRPRIAKFASSLDVKYFEPAHKPFAGELIRFLKYSKYSKEEILFIGDQIFTDVLCGNKCKVRTILLDPITKEEGLLIKFRRIIERPLRKRLAKKCKTYKI